jgi:Flp pilus assembly protein TadB
MFERREQIQKWFYEIIEKFRQKGALIPEKAMTARELDLPPRFETAMKRRLERSGVFIEVDGKYYLSEERLKQIEELRSQRGGTWNLRNRIMTLRLIQLAAVSLVIILFLLNLYVQSWELKTVSIVVLIVLLLMSILQFYYVSKTRRRFSQQTSNT